MSLQTIFDRVATHLIKQGVRSTLPDGSGCAYRGYNGTMCAVGCLIKDEDYDVNFESKSVRSADVFCAVQSSLGVHMNQQHGFLLSRLQAIHDYESPDNWYFELAHVAVRYDLSTRVLEQVYAEKGNKNAN